MEYKDKKTIVVMAGGTGGHVYPALAVADVLREEGFNIIWIGNENSFEAGVVSKSAYHMEYISIRGLRGTKLINTLIMPFRLISAVYQAVIILRRYEPVSVLGMGGYVSGPGAIACKLLKIPLIIHEQNSIPGFTNRILSGFAASVLVAFPNVFKNKTNTIYTGNPIRESITNLPEPNVRCAEHSGNIRLLVLGGSLGAKYLNDNLPVSLAQLPKGQNFDVWHQAGKGKHVETIAAYLHQNIQAKVVEFIVDMEAAYMWADLVICRAGAMTVSEISNVGVASILVPYPHAVDDHQTHNAAFLVNANAAIMAQQSDMTMTSLTTLLSGLLIKGRSYLLAMANNAYSLAKPDATLRVAQICMEAANA
ncbi:UDP-N-acetylglucosamine--N-acetylmuramyl-(pentapeptide) pyrophosphoryl-undecaprenol N-acetylglucosamine transferase [hydrothermal vent metagenome]|uniref:UDP-N-acetylglucosamine--N-acetylmuramyl-(Pentapeptide) pyrophosphoryl-undecaprenol N-acetylglucosamine transferase n=1 Tax=hydrothermal vent metagenome TaxID=652676 RepID=A0A3B1AH10_9ZZZZ